MTDPDGGLATVKRENTTRSKGMAELRRDSRPESVFSISGLSLAVDWFYDAV